MLEVTMDAWDVHPHVANFIIDNVNDDLSFVYCTKKNLYVRLQKLGYNVKIYDHNPYTTDNPIDVFFDHVVIPGTIVHPRCEYTYPIGKIYKGTFLLVGNDGTKDEWSKLYNCNPIYSIDQLIEQNEIKEVYQTKKWYHHYLVYGSN